MQTAATHVVRPRAKLSFARTFGSSAVRSHRFPPTGQAANPLALRHQLSLAMPLSRHGCDIFYRQICTFVIEGGVTILQHGTSRCCTVPVERSRWLRAFSGWSGSSRRYPQADIPVKLAGPHHSWRGGRVVECTGLENRRPFTRTVGSNPTPSANGNCSASGY